MSVPRRTLHQCIIHVSLNSLSKVLRCEQKYLNHSCLIVSRVFGSHTRLYSGPEVQDFVAMDVVPRLQISLSHF